MNAFYGGDTGVESDIIWLKYTKLCLVYEKQLTLSSRSFYPDDII